MTTLDEDWLYFAAEHARFEPASGDRSPVLASQTNGMFSPLPLHTKLAGATPSPRLIRVGQCQHCGWIGEVRVRS